MQIGPEDITPHPPRGPWPVPRSLPLVTTLWPKTFAGGGIVIDQI